MNDFSLREHYDSMEYRRNIVQAIEGAEEHPAWAGLRNLPGLKRALAVSLHNHITAETPKKVCRASGYLFMYLAAEHGTEKAEAVFFKALQHFTSTYGHRWADYIYPQQSRDIT